MEEKKSSLLPILLTILIVGIVTALIISAAQNSSDNTSQPATIITASTTPTPIPSSKTPVAQSDIPAPRPSYVAPKYYVPMTFAPAAESQRDSFVNGCLNSGGTWGKCNCNFDYIINNYGVVWLINENAYINVNGVASPEFRAEALNAVEYCSAYSN